MTVRRLSSAAVHADHAALAARDPRALAATLLRTRSVAGREVLAHLAGLGRLSSAEIAALPNQGLDARAVRNRLDPQWAGELARVLALQTGEVADQEAALGLFGALAEAGGLRALGDHATLYLQLLVHLRRRAEAQRMLPGADLPGRQHHGMVADLLNPFLPGGPEHIEPWLTELNSALLKRSFAPLELLPGAGQTPFDRVGADLGAPVTGGPLITVVMAAHDPGPELLTAVRSVRDQTWQRWELLVIDDASTAAAPGIWSQVAATDPRVRVIHQRVNGGTYTARNTALSQARGQLVTFLDADDWAHPAYLATGAEPLLASAGVLATRGWGARVGPDLTVTRPGYQVVVSAATSLMFRRQQVMTRIGFYDPVRKGADTEFMRRLETAFDRPVVVTTKAALTLMRADPRSLSAADFAAGWRHTSRTAYAQAHRDWHAQIGAGAPAYLDPGERRSFPAPRRWCTAQAGHQHPPAYDVLLAGDWRRHGGPQNSMLAEIAACRGAGLRVGILHLEALRFMTRRDDALCQPVRELLAAGEVDWVHLDDQARIGTLLLRYPPILQYPPRGRSALRPDRMLIVANQAPCEPDGADQRYVPADVTAHATALFDVPPTWVPQGPTVRRALERAGGAPLADWDNVGLIDAEAWRVRPDRPVQRPTVVGRYSRDDRIKFPASADELLTAYGFGPEVRVRMMGATRTVPHLLRQSGRSVRVPGNWELLAHKARDVREFLADLDFFVYLDNPGAHEAFGRVILEAAASGVLTIASPKHRDTFGDAVLYAEPDEVVPLVSRLAADPDQYRQQVALSLRRVAERFGYQGFATRMRMLAGQPTNPGG